MQPLRQRQSVHRRFNSSFISLGCTVQTQQRAGQISRDIRVGTFVCLPILSIVACDDKFINSFPLQLALNSALGHHEKGVRFLADEALQEAIRCYRESRELCVDLAADTVENLIGDDDGIIGGKSDGQFQLSVEATATSVALMRSEFNVGMALVEQKKHAKAIRYLSAAADGFRDLVSRRLSSVHFSASKMRLKNDSNSSEHDVAGVEGLGEGGVVGVRMSIEASWNASVACVLHQEGLSDVGGLYASSLFLLGDCLLALAPQPDSNAPDSTTDILEREEDQIEHYRRALLLPQWWGLSSATKDFVNVEDSPYLHAAASAAATSRALEAAAGISGAGRAVTIGAEAREGEAASRTGAGGRIVMPGSLAKFGRDSTCASTLTARRRNQNQYVVAAAITLEACTEAFLAVVDNEPESALDPLEKLVELIPSLSSTAARSCTRNFEDVGRGPGRGGEVQEREGGHEYDTFLFGVEALCDKVSARLSPYCATFDSEIRATGDGCTDDSKDGIGKRERGYEEDTSAQSLVTMDEGSRHGAENVGVGRGVKNFAAVNDLDQETMNKLVRIRDELSNLLPSRADVGNHDVSGSTLNTDFQRGRHRGEEEKIDDRRPDRQQLSPSDEGIPVSNLQQAASVTTIKARTSGATSATLATSPMRNTSFSQKRVGPLPTGGFALRRQRLKHLAKTTRLVGGGGGVRPPAAPLHGNVGFRKVSVNILSESGVGLRKVVDRRGSGVSSTEVLVNSGKENDAADTRRGDVYSTVRASNSDTVHGEQEGSFATLRATAAVAMMGAAGQEDGGSRASHFDKIQQHSRTVAEEYRDTVSTSGQEEDKGNE